AQNIHFFTEDLIFRLNNKTKIREWLRHAAREEGYRIAEISFIFCSDNYLLEMNRTYLNHDTFTDIITFDNSTVPGKLAGDIYISLPRIRENAKIFGVPEDAELCRVMIHGILHLCGYGDKKKDEKVLMREKEDTYIRLYKTKAI
ncbi:MAG: rRNA maturation RNase YbeY, partial [Actinomadura sp.]